MLMLPQSPFCSRKEEEPITFFGEQVDDVEDMLAAIKKKLGKSARGKEGAG